MAASLILDKKITTTVAKAKALRVYVEPMITRSKTDSTHSRRMVFRYLQNKIAVNELFREVSVKVADRPGGYTRIIRLGNRLGDNAEMCMIELVDFNEHMLGRKAPAKAKATRRRGGAKKSSQAVETKTKEVVSAEVETEVKQAATPEAEAKVESAPETNESAPETNESAPETNEPVDETNTGEEKAEA